MIKRKDIKPGALEIIHILSENGFQAVLNGGCVRDLVMGRDPKDWDVATNADPETVKRLFDRTVPIGIHFGIITVLLEDGQYEVARFRKDHNYEDGRHPRMIEFADAEADAQRRDFTVNGMFFDVFTERIIDYVGGVKDIDQQLIRTIGNPVERFAEDQLRMLRAVRFAARLGFAIDEQTQSAICSGAKKIKQISVERIREEISLILTEGSAAIGAQMLMDLGLLSAILPVVSAMKDVPQPSDFHPEGDVWTHVRIMLDQLKSPTRTLAWGVLLHDVGKPRTLTLTDRIRFHGHDTFGARIADTICRRLHMSKADSEQIQHLTEHHMRFRNVKEMRHSKLKRFLREEYFPELLELHRIDCLASHGMLDLYDYCKEKLDAADNETMRPSPLITGHDLVKMGYEPGPKFKEILTVIEDAQLEGNLHSREEAIDLVRKLFDLA